MKKKLIKIISFTIYCNPMRIFNRTMLLMQVHYIATEKSEEKPDWNQIKDQSQYRKTEIGVFHLFEICFLQVTAQSTVSWEIEFNRTSGQIALSLRKIHAQVVTIQPKHTNVGCAVFTCYESWGFLD